MDAPCFQLLCDLCFRRCMDYDGAWFGTVCVCVCCRFRLFSISFWIICTWSGLTTKFLLSIQLLMICTLLLYHSNSIFCVCVCECICINISLHSGHKYFFLSFFPCFWIQPLRSVSLLAFLYFFPSIRRFLCNSSSSSDSAYFVDLFVSFMQCKCKHK